MKFIKLLKGVIKIFLFLFFLQTSLPLFAQSKLDQSKKELNDKKLSNSTTTLSNNSSSSHSYRSRNNHHQSFLGELIGNIILRTTKAIFIGNNNSEINLQNEICSYPFANCKGVVYTNSRDSSTKKLRFELSNQFLYESNSLWGNYLNTNFRPSKYFFLQAGYTALQEKVAISNQISNLSIFDFSFCYDRIRNEKFNIGWLVGVRYIGSTVKKVGFEYGLQSNLTIVKNISISSAVKWSMVNKQPVNDFGLDLNCHLKKFAISTGYKYIKIATPEYKFWATGVKIYL